MVRWPRSEAAGAVTRRSSDAQSARDGRCEQADPAHQLHTRAWAVGAELTTYQSVKTYSPTHDNYVHRVSMGNEHGHELFVLIVDDAGPAVLRARRAAAVDAIQEAIDLGMDPGEVRVSPAIWRQMVADAMKERV